MSRPKPKHRENDKLPKPNKSDRSGKSKPEHKVLVSGSIQAYPPPEIAQKHEAERKEDAAAHESERKEERAVKSKELLLEGLTLAAVVIYAGITFWQGCLTRESINNNTKQFQIDQRPYVWNSNVTDPANVKIEAGQKMWINIGLLNFGKAPALNARGVATIFIGSNAMRDADNWFAALGDGAFADDPSDTGIVIPPGIPSGEITTKSAFGGGGFFTPMSDKVLTRDDVNYILHSNETVAIVVHMQYFDAYGTRYWSNFCLSRFETGVYPNCKKHNEIH